MQFMERKQMLILIDPSNYEFHRQDLDDMYRLRHKVFYEKLKWDVKSVNGMERDEYDEKHAHYIIYKDEQGVVRGCIRLIEMTNPCMFDGPFKFLFSDLKEFKRPRYWEISRLGVDCRFDEAYTPRMSSHITASIFAATIHFGLKLKNIRLFLILSFPHLIKLCTSHKVILAPILDRKFDDNQLLITGCPPNHYSYKKLLEKISHDPCKTLLHYTDSSLNLASGIKLTHPIKNVN